MGIANYAALQREARSVLRDISGMLRTTDLHRHAMLGLNGKIVIEAYDTVNLGFRDREAVSESIETLGRYAAECGLYAMQTGN